MPRTKKQSLLLSKKNYTHIQKPKSTIIHTTLSPKASRTLINRHHNLQKRLNQALAKNDLSTAEALRAEIETNGGLERYQQASISGQSPKRGGDSSKILMEWIHQSHKPHYPLRMLEVGSLDINNHCSKSALFDITRIDLNSRHPDILSQDFMKRPLPINEDDKFHIISLSLVLNYVPTPPDRGEMLRRTTAFLRDREQQLFPSLFLVLPLPCISNSRYLDEDRLTEMMESLGYLKVRRKVSSKLVYYLWVFRGRSEMNGSIRRFKKEEVNPGRHRNNFAIVLE